MQNPVSTPNQLYESIKNINLDVQEGKLLIAALSRLSCQPAYSNKTPDEIYKEIFDLAKEIYT